MRIRAVVERTVKVESNVRNARVDLSEMTVTALAVLTDRIVEGRPVAGFAFNSFGRYGCGGVLRERFIPRLLDAAPAACLDEAGDNLDPARIMRLLTAREKAGGHAERSMALGTLEIALWDIVAKVEEKPLAQVIAERFGAGRHRASLPAYAAGGFYGAADPVASVHDEVRSWLDQGFTDVKIKGGDLSVDPARIEAVRRLVGDGGRLALDLSCAFDAKGARDYARRVKPFDPWWLEEPCDPLDYEGFAAVSGEGVQVAGGENLFSPAEFENFLRYARLPGPVVLMPDPPFVYGLGGLAEIVALAERHGVARSSIYPHGGNLMSLHMVAGLDLGGVEAYPGQFGIFGGFGRKARVEDGRVCVPDVPGIGFEEQPALFALFDELRAQAEGPAGGRGTLSRSARST